MAGGVALNVLQWCAGRQGRADFTIALGQVSKRGAAPWHKHDAMRLTRTRQRGVFVGLLAASCDAKSHAPTDYSDDEVVDARFGLGRR